MRCVICPPKGSADHIGSRMNPFEWYVSGSGALLTCNHLPLSAKSAIAMAKGHDLLTSSCPQHLRLTGCGRALSAHRFYRHLARSWQGYSTER